ncbi:MAG TPA: FmdB family zinc ribbon protein [Candidatus Acidoferrales bacterium]|nr:FmdB family zinc ribbon protein [Candidatus Acidoferrales bacterium]
MPLYEYECTACHHRFEKIEKFTAPTKRACPKCGKAAKRILAASAFQFKGSGWYVTDYGRGKPSASPEPGKSDTKTESTTGAAASGKTSGNGSGKGTAPSSDKGTSAKKD